MNRSSNKGRKRFRYGTRKPRVISAALSRAVERFFTLGLRLSGFLHQFKTPLHVIQSQAELLLDDSTLSSATRKSLEMIKQNTERLTAQTQSVMDLAKGKIQANQDLSLDSLVATICDAAQADCRKKNITLERQSGSASLVRMDAAALEGAIHNVINNAIEAMPKGGVLKVRTFDTPDAHRLGVEILDTGTGMDGRALRKVTRSPFQTTKATGTGLGIYITKHILQRHKASMKWESKPGQGTKVTILFPAIPDVRSPSPIGRGPSQARGEAAGSRGLWHRVISAFAVLLIFFMPVNASHTPTLLRLQGRFTDNQKVPLTDNLPIRFSVWDSEDGYGNLLWQDIQNVSIQSNTFQVVLGRLTPLPPSVFSGGDRWLEMQIANDAPLRPRHRIPYQVIAAQVAAPIPQAVTPTPEDKRDLEIQIDKYREEVPVAIPAPKAVPVAAPVPVPVAVPVPAPVAAVPVKHHPRPKPVHTAPASDDTGAGNVYTVQPGDTLKSIAQKLYGNAELWYDLYYLNRDRLGPMGHLFTGQILVLPDQNPGEKPR